MRHEAVSFPACGATLRGTLVHPDEERQTGHAALFVHGLGSSASRTLQFAEAAAAQGVTALAFDLRGHGEYAADFAETHLADCLRDVTGAYMWLFECRGIAPEKRHLVGSSFGCYLAALMLNSGERFGLSSMAFRAPAIYPNEWQCRRLPELRDNDELARYRRRPHRPSDNMALAAAARYQGSVLVVESEHDERVPHATVQNYLAAFRMGTSPEHRTLCGCEHQLDTTGRDLYALLLARWFMAVSR